MGPVFFDAKADAATGDVRRRSIRVPFEVRAENEVLILSLRFIRKAPLVVPTLLGKCLLEIGDGDRLAVGSIDVAFVLEFCQHGREIHGRFGGFGSLGPKKDVSHLTAGSVIIAGSRKHGEAQFSRRDLVGRQGIGRDRAVNPDVCRLAFHQKGNIVFGRGVRFGTGRAVRPSDHIGPITSFQGKQDSVFVNDNEIIIIVSLDTERDPAAR